MAKRARENSLTDLLFTIFQTKNPQGKKAIKKKSLLT
jgi:hypothetical protein